MNRFATEIGLSIPGILPKLLNFARSKIEINSIVTYADLSWGFSDAYQQQGFVFSHFTEPNYFYFKNVNDIKSRIAFQKHKIVQMSQDTTDSMSESQIAENLGYNRFFDAGNSVWLKTF